MPFFETQEEDDRRTRQFVTKALQYGLEDLYPDFDDEKLGDLTKLVQNYFDAQEGSPDEQEALDRVVSTYPSHLDDPVKDRENIKALVLDVSGAIAGLGIDIFEPGAVHQILWHGKYHE